MSINKHFEVLGLKQGASKDKIRSAYRSLAKKYHPDISDDPNAEDKFIAVNLAYEILIDYKEGGAPTYSVHNDVWYKNNTKYHNSQFMHTEMEAAWAKQRQTAREEYETYFDIPWYHPDKPIWTLVKHRVPSPTLLS